ncbi:hypothetical protein N657DRAFT_651038 [Parathielavia appendiculata]|uniref:Uncharacterized protein n=1 Tax=Parathielavia appendiculata TaxID=2587402 RepID=A0AAN6TQD0_9PEZI|nr:hypothetical protein N657DRAFT_651038 [Parathielavia appendiculata]
MAQRGELPTSPSTACTIRYNPHPMPLTANALKMTMPTPSTFAFTTCCSTNTCPSHQER